MLSASSVLRNAVLAAAVLFGENLSAQVQTLDLAPILRNVRLGKDLGAAHDILVQANSSFPQQVLDALADSLVAITLTGPRESHVPRPERAQALTILMFAAQGRGGVAYPRAADCLLRIAIDTTVIGEQGGAVYSITQLPDTSVAIRLLAEVATSRSFAAGDGISELYLMGPRGLAKLRELHTKKTVVGRDAAERLDVIARIQHWK